MPQQNFTSCQNNEKYSLQRERNLSLGLQFMEYKKPHSCQNTTSTAVVQEYKFW